MENEEVDYNEDENEKVELESNDVYNSFTSPSSFSIYVPPIPLPSEGLKDLENDLYNIQFILIIRTDLATLKITNPTLFSMLKLNNVFFIPGTSYIRTSLKGLSMKEIGQLASSMKSVKSQINGFRSRLNKNNQSNRNQNSEQNKSFNYSYYFTGNNHNALV